jgi:SAM-dependent methyltransferase
MKSLDLGCGDTIRNPFNAEELFGIDIVDTKVDNLKICDLTIEQIPYEDNTFDYVTAFDFLEHIPRILYRGDVCINPFINVMSEIWRVLKPGGLFNAQTPAFPNPETFQDPTHVNFITEKTYVYFAGEHLNLGQSYGFKGKFKLMEQFWHPVHSAHLIWLMKAVK